MKKLIGIIIMVLTLFVACTKEQENIRDVGEGVNIERIGSQVKIIHNQETVGVVLELDQDVSKNQLELNDKNSLCVVEKK